MTTSRNKLLPLYEQVARLIHQEIETGRFAPGDKIASIREICERFKVGDVTAKRAIRTLRQRGIIRTVAGSGAYVTDRGAQQAPPAQKQQVVGFLKVRLHTSPIFSYEMDLIQQELRLLGHAMIYSVAETDEAVPEVLGQMIEAGAGCLLLFPSHAYPYEEAPYLRQVRAAAAPLLILESRGKKDSYVSADIERATAELAGYLYGIGHRRICLATRFGRKVAGFRSALGQWNDPSVRHWIVEEHDETTEGFHKLAQQVLDLAPRPTAVITKDDHATAVMVTHFLRAGVRVPEDLSVAGYDDHPIQSKLCPIPMTGMRHPCREIAQEVAQWAHGRLTNRAPKGRRLRREITGTLIVRDSTAPICSG